MHDISLQTSVQTCDAIVRSLDGNQPQLKLASVSMWIMGKAKHP